MTKAPFSTLFLVLLLAVMAPVTAFGNIAPKTVSVVSPSLQQQKLYQHPPSALFLRSSKSSSRIQMYAGISAPSLSLVSSVVSKVRGGASVAAAASTPTKLFNTCLLAVAMLTTTFKVFQAVDSKKTAASSEATTKTKPESVKELQRKFLSVFWLLRCADWLQGPYFYEVYASKMFGGAPASMAMISRLFLTGFASTAIFGPSVGRAIDSYGRKKGTLAFTVLYAIGALSTKSPLLMVLLFGRVMSGIGTSLLFSAPESWLVGESQKSGDDPDGEYLGETFGMVGFAYLSLECCDPKLLRTT